MAAAVFLVSAACFGVFAALSLLPAPLHGDEAHYLVMARSLAEDCDLELSNNYSPDRTADLSSQPLVPHRATFSGQEVYSSHAPGLPLVIAIPFALAGRTGVTLFLVILNALGMILAGCLMSRFSGSNTAALAGIAAMAATLPVVMMSSMVYPEMICALLISAAILCTPRSMPAVISQVMILSAIPWFHMKFSLLSVGLFVILISENRRHPRRLWVAVLLAAMNAGVFLALQYRWFGDPFHLVRFMASGFMNPLAGLTGLFIDREAGLLVYSPVYGTAAFAAPVVWRHRHRPRVAPLLPLGVISLVYLLLAASWIDWHGGHCPPARYLIPVLPIWIGWSAAGLTFGPRRFRAGFAILAGLSAAATIQVIRTMPETVITLGDGMHRLWAASGHHIGEYFPSLLCPRPGHGWMIAGWLGVLTANGLFLSGITSAPSGKRRYWLWACMLVLIHLSPFMILRGHRVEARWRTFQAAQPLDPSPPTLRAPADGTRVTTRMPELSWEPVDGAEGYQWQIIFPDGFTVNGQVRNGTRYQLPDSILPALKPGDYRWNVAAFKGDAWGRASPTRLFRVVPQ